MGISSMITRVAICSVLDWTAGVSHGCPVKKIMVNWMKDCQVERNFM